MLKYVNFNKIKNSDKKIRFYIGLTSIVTIVISAYALYKLNNSTPTKIKRKVEIYFYNKELLTEYEDMVVVYNDQGLIMDAVLSTTEYNPAEIYINGSKCFIKSDYLNLEKELPNIKKEQKIVVVIDYNTKTMNINIQNQ